MSWLWCLCKIWVRSKCIVSIIISGRSWLRILSLCVFWILCFNCFGIEIIFVMCKLILVKILVLKVVVVILIIMVLFVILCRIICCKFWRFLRWRNRRVWMWRIFVMKRLRWFVVCVWLRWIMLCWVSIKDEKLMGRSIWCIWTTR